MKRIVIILIFLASQASGAVFAYVQSKSQTGNTALAFTSNNTAGNLIVVMMSHGAVTAVTDTQNNTYFKATNVNRTAVWYALNIAAGANSVTATGLNSSGAESSIAILEYTVPASYSVIGGASIVVANTAAMAKFQTVVETLLVFSAYDGANNHSWTGTGLTVREVVNEGGGQGFAVGDTEVASVATSSTFSLKTCQSSGGCNTAFVIATAPGGGASTPSASAFVGVQ